MKITASTIALALGLPLLAGAAPAQAPSFGFVPKNMDVGVHVRKGPSLKDEKATTLHKLFQVQCVVKNQVVKRSGGGYGDGYGPSGGGYGDGYGPSGGGYGDGYGPSGGGYGDGYGTSGGGYGDGYGPSGGGYGDGYGPSGANSPPAGDWYRIRKEPEAEFVSADSVKSNVQPPPSIPKCGEKN